MAVSTANAPKCAAPETKVQKRMGFISAEHCKDLYLLSGLHSNLSVSSMPEHTVCCELNHSSADKECYQHGHDPPMPVNLGLDTGVLDSWKASLARGV